MDANTVGQPQFYLKTRCGLIVSVGRGLGSRNIRYAQTLGSRVRKCGRNLIDCLVLGIPKWGPAGGACVSSILVLPSTNNSESVRKNSLSYTYNSLKMQLLPILCFCQQSLCGALQSETFISGMC